jgi:hypothetical protein
VRCGLFLAVVPVGFVLSFAQANSTNTPSTVPQPSRGQITTCEGMAFLTMRLPFCAVGNAVRRELDIVLPNGRRLQMLRVHAPAILALMMERCLFLDWTDKGRIHGAVGTEPTRMPNRSVSLSVNNSSPIPATSFLVNRDALKEKLAKGNGSSSHEPQDSDLARGCTV